MRIVEQTQDTLVVEDAPWVLRVFVLGFIAIVALALWHNPAQTPWVARWLISGLLILFAVALAKVAPTVTARFDRAGGQIDIARRGLFGAKLESYGLQHFRRARVEETSNRGATSRLVLVFSDSAAAGITPAQRKRRERGRTWDPRALGPNEVAFTAYLSSGGGPMAAAAAINTWAGTAL